MKIFIGPYINWWGPFQLADLLKYVGVSDDRRHEIGDWLSTTWVSRACEFIHARRKRKIKIRIDKYDTWSMDSTLSMLILPMLKQLKETKHGYPLVDDEHVPEHLRSTAAPPVENAWDLDDNALPRWEWVMDEMIWAFEQLQPDFDDEAQFSSGNLEMIMVPADPSIDPTGTMKQLVRGPNDTYKVDTEGLKVHHDRIQNALKLFGIYYRNLWD